MAITAVPLTATTAKGMTSAHRGTLTVVPGKATAAVTIYKNSLVSRTTSTGYLIPAGDTASTTFAGIAMDGCVATTDSSNPDIALAKNGVWEMNLNTGTATEASIGTAVFVADDNTVDVTGQVSNQIACGKISYFVSTTRVGVDISGYAY